MNAIMRSFSRYPPKEWISYFCSTHFWGPVANWGIPIATLADLKKNPDLISGPMTTALCIYSAVFMRFALRVEPRNLLLFSCHSANLSMQLMQMARFLNHNYLRIMDDPTFNHGQNSSNVFMKKGE